MEESSKIAYKRYEFGTKEGWGGEEYVEEGRGITSTIFKILETIGKLIRALLGRDCEVIQGEMLVKLIIKEFWRHWWTISEKYSQKKINSWSLYRGT